MTNVFLHLLNISFMASWTMLAIVLLRLLMRKAPKWTICLLWAILALRLLLPFSFESSFSLIPSSQVIPADIAFSETPAIYSGIPQLNSAVNPALIQTVEQPGTLESVLQVASVVWLCGVALMLLYSVISWLLLHWKVRVSLRYRDNIYICDDIKSPFVLGVFRPRVYISSGLDSETFNHVLAHENAHIHRRDYFWKPAGYLLLSLYWFNPLLWIAYILLCRDIERACDEKVLGKIGDGEKVGYANALLQCSTHRRQILTCPVAFGEVSVSSRVKNALRYKKPAIWIVASSLLLCGGVVMCFLTDPQACVHDYVVQVNAAATCTHKGVETYTCKNCQHSYMAYVDICPHTYGEPTVVQAPNCTQEGQSCAACIDCGVTLLQPIPKDENIHDMAEVERLEPTCTQVGKQVFSCTRCDYKEETELPKAKHQYGESRELPATCFISGLMYYYCDNCDHCYSKKIPEKDHKWTSAGGGYEKCVYCGWRRNPNYDFLSTTVGNQTSPTPQFPVIQWDIAQSVRPKPTMP